MSNSCMRPQISLHLDFSLPDHGLSQTPYTWRFSGEIPILEPKSVPKSHVSQLLGTPILFFNVFMGIVILALIIY